MKRFFKTTGVCIVILFVIIAISYGFIANNIKGRALQEYYYSIDTLMIRQDKEALQRGRHLVAIKGCTDCHGNDLGGKVFLDDPKLGRVSASNLTKGRGGLPSDYQVSNWVMALKHGVNKERKALWIMPSQETAMLSREDLSSIIAYCMQVKPVNREMPKNKIGPMLNILAFMDKLPLFPVEKIDHSQKVVESVNNYSPVEMGKYLSVSCVGCHKDNLKGGESPIPGSPPVPDITSAGKPGKWKLAEFLKTLRTGKTPDGHQMRNQDMPWKMTAQYSDKELEALYYYLKSIK